MFKNRKIFLTNTYGHCRPNTWYPLTTVGRSEMDHRNAYFLCPDLPLSAANVPLLILTSTPTLLIISYQEFLLN